MTSINASLTKTLAAPFERIKLILQNQYTNQTFIHGNKKYTGIINCAVRIYREEGITTFWRGSLTNIIRYSIQQSLNFTLNKFFQKQLIKKETNKNNLQFYYQAILSGGFSGAVSLVLVYPLDFIRTRLGADVHQKVELRQFKGIKDCVNKIYKVDGVKGFYRGVGIGFVFYFLYRGFYFGGYEIIKEKFKDQNTFWIAFYTFNLISLQNFMLYPIDTVRRRLMMQSGRGKENLHYKGIFDCIVKIYQQEGVKAYYNGALINLIRCFGPIFLLIWNDFTHDYFAK